MDSLCPEIDILTYCFPGHPSSRVTSLWEMRFGHMIGWSLKTKMAEPSVTPPKAPQNLNLDVWLKQGHVDVVPHGGRTLRKIRQISKTKTSPRLTGYKSVRPRINTTGELEYGNKFDHTALLKSFQNLINMLESSYVFVACSSHLPRGSVHTAWMLLHDM